jgi:hypothetical protein
MSTSVRKENRFKRMIFAQNDAADKLKREFEAAFMPRNTRPVINTKPPTPCATRRNVRSWMRRNANDFDNATSLAEAANCNLDLPIGAMDDETHWVWDEAISAIEWSESKNEIY